MDFFASFKIVFLLLWPFLLLFIYYLVDRKGFKSKMQKLLGKDFNK